MHRVHFFLESQECCKILTGGTCAHHREQQALEEAPHPGREVEEVAGHPERGAADPAAEARNPRQRHGVVLEARNLPRVH